MNSNIPHLNHFDINTLKKLHGKGTHRHTDSQTHTFTKPPLLQESRLTGGGSPKLVGLVEWKVPVEWEMGAANSFH